MTAGRMLLWLSEAVLEAGVVLGLAAGIAALLGRAPARTRHAVWAGALTGVLLVPALSPWLPRWSIAALPTPVLASGAADPVLASGAADLGLTSEAADPVLASGAAKPGLASEAAEPGLAARRPSPPGPMPAAAAVAASASGDLRWPADTRAGVWTRVSAASPAAWLLTVWLLGCAATLAAFLRALGAARRLGKSATAVDARWLAELAAARRRVGVRRPVRLYETSEVATPMTWGWLRPVVLLPAGARRWSPERRRIVLLHELVHIRRGDWLLRLMARTVCSVYWPNPLAWAAARRLAAEQEMACDEEVVALGTRPSSYAGHLLAIARSRGPCPAAPAHALDMARRSQMEGRLMSILDGGRRLRGGRKLAIPALLLIAGLVSVLAAIEPWAEGQDLPPTSAAAETAQEVPRGETAGVARVLGELEDLAGRMKPFEAELEGLEREMQPIARGLAGVEVEMDPVEAELEALEVELEPFAEMIEAVEVEIEPHLGRLEEIELELAPFEERLEALEAEMRPFERQLEEIEVELAPFEERLEETELELAPLARELERFSEQMEPLARGGGPPSAELERIAAEMQEVHRRMAPLYERLGATHEEMEPIYRHMSATHGEMEPLYERMNAIHREMEPVFERMAAVHQDLQPLYDRLAVIHRQMRPVHERLGAAHERMRPFHQRMGEQHEAMQPYHRKMGEIHERMRPLHEEMGRRHLDLERELESLVERMLARDLAGITAAGTDYAAAAARIVEAVSLRVDDGRLRVSSSAPRIREILEQALAAQGPVAGDELAEAVERFVLDLSGLEIAAP